MSNIFFRIPSFRSMLRRRCLDILGLFSMPAPGIHILNGHRIEDEPQPETFRKLLQQLSFYVEFIKIEDAVAMIERKEIANKSLVAFTFDDGFMECYEIFAPILEEFDINGLFFVNPHFVEGDEAYIRNFNDNVVLTPNKRPMRWAHLQELAQRGHIIGAHTMDHYMINTNEEHVLRYQIETCKELIAEKVGKPCEYFAFPYGKLDHANQQSIDIACRKYRHVFSQSDYKHYFSFQNTVINRRHFEPFWPLNHVKYFISCKKTYV